MITEKHKIVLVLAPHTDDGEFGCGATISRFVREGAEVHYVAFSSCQKSVPEGLPRDILITEMKSATSELGINSNRVRVLDYEVREFSSSRQAILDDLLKLRNEISPDLVFIPSLDDVHQDHQAISIEAIRAFKFSSILCYELPWNNFSFSHDCFVSVTEEDMNTKVRSLSCYKSQLHRSYASVDFIRSLAKVKGVQSLNEFAEAFEVKRLMIRN